MSEYRHDMSDKAIQGLAQSAGKILNRVIELETKSLIADQERESAVTALEAISSIMKTLSEEIIEIKRAMDWNKAKL